MKMGKLSRLFLRVMAMRKLISTPYSQYLKVILYIGDGSCE